MNPVVVFIILFVINIPMYAFFAWIMFDDLRKAGGSIGAGLFKALSLLISLRLFAYVLADQDEDNAMFNFLVVFVASGLLLYGEFRALWTWWPSLFGKA